MTVRDRVLAALSTVRDPELDEPVTALLPTYFCAPNFAFLMVADAYDAVSTVDGVGRVEVVLDEHFAADAINEGVAARAGFVRTFGGEALAELHDLRADFLRKAVLAGTDQVCRPLVTAGVSPAELARLTMGAAPPTPALDRLRQRRAELGLPAGDSDPLLVDPVTGAAVPAGTLPLHLRRARTTRTSLEANTGICRGMLRVRYHSAGAGEEER
jgi:hypothetical protein